MSGRSLGNEAFLALVRTLVGMTVPASIAVFIWYTRQGHVLRDHFDMIGLLAVATLALLALHTLRPHVYRTHGRMTIAAFALWTGLSALWRLLAILHLINADDRLLTNTIVAVILALAGIYVHFTHQTIKRLWRILTEPPNAGNGVGGGKP